jgi:hypothetical protein
MFSKQDCVENFLHSMIDQYCDIQPDKGCSVENVYEALQLSLEEIAFDHNPIAPNFFLR